MCCFTEPHAAINYGSLKLDCILIANNNIQQAFKYFSVENGMGVRWMFFSVTVLYRIAYKLTRLYSSLCTFLIMAWQCHRLAQTLFLCNKVFLDPRILSCHPDAICYTLPLIPRQQNALHSSHHEGQFVFASTTAGWIHSRVPLDW